MQVLQVNASISADFGGPALGSLQLNRALNQAGSEAWIVSGAYTTPGSSGTTPLDERLKLPTGVRGQVVPSARPHRLENFRRSVTLLRQLVGSNDGVHIHGLYSLPGVIAAMWCDRLGVPYGIQPHGNFEPYQARKSRARKRLAWLAFQRRAIMKAKYILVASESEADNVQRATGHPNVVVQPLGAFLEEPIRPEADWADRVSASGRQNCVLFLGRLAKKKRPDRLIESWASSISPEGLLIVAGPDGEHTSDELARLAERLGVGDRVVFPGALYGPAKAWALANCAIFTLPSENENYGVAIAEAMLAGAAIVTTQGVAAGAHVRRARAGLVVPVGAVQEFGAAVSELLIDRDRAEALGARAREYAASELTWAKVAATILAELGEAPEVSHQ